MKKISVREMTVGALLIALAILIPNVMPKIVIGPASFTLASHVPLFIAMFFSPLLAAIVAVGTTFGFALSGLPFIITLRAASHIVFALLGSWYLQKHPETVLVNGEFKAWNWKFQAYNLVMALIHTVAEVLVVVAFNFIDLGNAGTYDGGAFFFFFVLMGVGGLIHSVVDYNIAYYVTAAVSKQFTIPVFRQAKELFSKKVTA
ncbi:hypothetical protein [Enterococcus sp. 2201sp1_2201st1_B8_2201SCRN_220225]|uniref:hypothetical protein n=1 Tax=unclassified Enterococcus TaxID=2608891 RepID=UPI0034A40E2C